MKLCTEFIDSAQNSIHIHGCTYLHTCIPTYIHREGLAFGLKRRSYNYLGSYLPTYVYILKLMSHSLILDRKLELEVYVPKFKPSL